MLIPWQEVENDTLHNLIHEFVLREGTDYVEYEIPQAQKIQQVLLQLQTGDAFIVYSELHQTIDIKNKVKL